MKVDTPQISWHGNESDHGWNAPLLSIALLPQTSTTSSSSSSSPMVFATAGNDSTIHLWTLHYEPAQATAPSPSSTPVPTAKAQAQAKISHTLSLTRHTSGASSSSVNTLQFSPDGTSLACAGDAGTIVLWSLPQHLQPHSTNADGNTGDIQSAWRQLEKESELTIQLGAGISNCNCEDVFDLCFFPKVLKLNNASNNNKKNNVNVLHRFAVGSLDHAVLLLEQEEITTSSTSTSDAVTPVHTSKKKLKCIWSNKDHSHYVQGVACDPLGVYLCSMGSDRSIRVFCATRGERRNKQAQEENGGGVMHCVKCIRYLEREEPAVAEPAKLPEDAAIVETAVIAAAPKKKERRRNLFVDEITMESFFRRLTWTVDGAYLIAPAGLWTDESSTTDEANNDDDTSSTSFATFLFARHCWEKPRFVLAGLKKPSVAVRANPILFSLPHPIPPTTTSSHPSNFKVLPYRTIFAVLTSDTIYIYDTYTSTLTGKPLAIAHGLHYAGLTDGSWSSDGRVLSVCSSDGYVSFVKFEEGELGEVYIPPHPLPEQKTQEASHVSVDGMKASAATVSKIEKDEELRVKVFSQTVKEVVSFPEIDTAVITETKSNVECSNSAAATSLSPSTNLPDSTKVPVVPIDDELKMTMTILPKVVSSRPKKVTKEEQAKRIKRGAAAVSADGNDNKQASSDDHVQQNKNVKKKKKRITPQFLRPC